MEQDNVVRLKNSLNYVCGSKNLANYALDKGCTLRSIDWNKTTNPEIKEKSPMVYVFRNDEKFQETLAIWMKLSSEEKMEELKAITQKHLEEDMILRKERGNI